MKVCSTPRSPFFLYIWIYSLSEGRGGHMLTPNPAGQWKLSISIPDAYPMAPPSVHFLTPICHPNVNFKVPFFSPLHFPLTQPPKMLTSRVKNTDG